MRCARFHQTHGTACVSALHKHGEAYEAEPFSISLLRPSYHRLQGLQLPNKRFHSLSTSGDRRPSLALCRGTTCHPLADLISLTNCLQGFETAAGGLRLLSHYPGSQPQLQFMTHSAVKQRKHVTSSYWSARCEATPAIRVPCPDGPGLNSPGFHPRLLGSRSTAEPGRQAQLGSQAQGIMPSANACFKQLEDSARNSTNSREQSNCRVP